MSNKRFQAGGENYFNKDEFKYDPITQTMRLKHAYRGVINNQVLIPRNTTKTYTFSVNLGNNFADIETLFYSITPENVYGATPFGELLQGVITELKPNEDSKILKSREFAFTLVDTDDNDKYFALESIQIRNTLEYHIYFKFVSNNKPLKNTEVIKYNLSYIKRV